VFVAMVTNRYKSSTAVAHGTRTKLGARFRLFTTIRSVSESENIRHFSLSCNFETYVTVLYAYVKLNIWCLRLRHSRRH